MCVRLSAKGLGAAGAARAAALCALLLLAQLAAGCVGGARGRRQMLELVPATSVVAAALDWRAVSADAGLRRMVPSREVEGLFAELGLSGAEVDELVVFGDGREARTGAAGAILSGSFTAAEVVERLRGRGWREQEEAGETLYAAPNGQDYCAPLDDMLVAGTRAGVAAALRGDEGLGSNPAYEQLAAHLEGSDAPVLIVVAAPQRVQDMADAGLSISAAALEFAQLDLVAGLVKQLGAVRGVGCALAHAGGEFPVELVAVMRDEETAGLVSGTLNLAQSLAPALPQGPGGDAAQREAVEQLRRMTIEREAEVLAIKFVMTEAQLQGR